MATIGEKEIKTKYPVEEGLIAETTKQTGKTMNLLYTTTIVRQRETKGIR